MEQFVTITSLSRALRDKKISSREAVAYYFKQIDTHNERLNAYITVAHERAFSQARVTDDRRAAGDELPALAGVPFGVKDAICTEGVRSTGSARILDNYVPPFDATVVARLRATGAIMIGKQNCDAFGHGASNENSMYGPVTNPWDASRVAGGSSGGSAAAVAADLCAFAIGEDTGGSIRAPASFCGVTGLKVSYGRTSRYGAMPMASSLDTVGPFARTAEDAALIMEVIAGHDAADATTDAAGVPSYTTVIHEPLAGLRVGVPKEFFTDELDGTIRHVVEVAISELEKQGATLVPISLPHTPYAIATYYILVPCEDSSNLARLDGIRYGVRASAQDLHETYTASRTAGFPDEVKRRIMIGTFALSHGYYDAYYRRAQQVRTLIKQDFDRAFASVDAIATPTTPETAFPIGSKSDDPLKMYLSDAFVGPASLSGVCALSVPCGFVNGMPVGMQIIAPRMREDVALRVGHQYQLHTNWHKKHPNL